MIKKLVLCRKSRVLGPVKLKFYMLYIWRTIRNFFKKRNFFSYLQHLLSCPLNSEFKLYYCVCLLQLQLKYQACNIPDKTKACNVQASLGIAWLKSTKHQKRITQNIMSNSSIRLKEIFSEVEKELMNRKHGWSPGLEWTYTCVGANSSFKAKCGSHLAQERSSKDIHILQEYGLQLYASRIHEMAQI